MKILFTTALFFLTLFTIAQTTFSGKVTDAKRLPIEGVNVAIKDSYDGTVTDKNGNYKFETTDTGSLKIEFTKVGYTTIIITQMANGQTLNNDVILKLNRTDDNVIIITAGSFEAGDKKRGATLTALDVLTTGGANADISSALKTLPGTQQVGESEGLFVRGGTASETKVFIDGTPVTNFFYSGTPDVAARGRFFPTIFKGTQFNTGGYSALYGQALSSALILESVDMPDKSEANLGVSILSLGGGFQQLAKNKRASFGINYGFTNVALAFAIAPQKFNFNPVPTFHTLETNFRFKIGKSGFLKYYSAFNASRIGQGRPSLDSIGLNSNFNIKNIYNYHNLSYKQNLVHRWKINIGSSVAYNNDIIGSTITNANKNILNATLPSYLKGQIFNLNSKNYYANLKLVLEKKFESFNTVRFGAEYNYSNEKIFFTNNVGASFNEPVTENLTSIFGEGDIYINDNMALKIGGRVEHSNLLQKLNAAPRVSLAYKFIDKSQLSFSYGIFYQNPERRLLPAVSNISFMQSTQYVLQYTKGGKGRTFRAEAFYKLYNNLVKTGINNFGQSKAINNNGTGNASGLEFFFRDTKTIKNFDYWVSYSYLNAKRNFLNYPTTVQPTFAARHNGSLVMKRFLTSIMTGFNLSYTASEGRPYYNPNKPASAFLTDRTKAFHTIGFSTNWLPKLPFKNTFAVVVLSVNNVLGFNQTFGYNYSSVPFNGQYRAAAVTPPSKRFYFLGVFLNFGTDNRQDVINNNL